MFILVDRDKLVYLPDTLLKECMETSRKVLCCLADSQQVKCWNTVASFGTLPHRVFPNISGIGFKRNLLRLRGSVTCALDKAPHGIYAFPGMISDVSNYG